MSQKKYSNSTPVFSFVREIIRPFHWYLAGMVFVAIAWAVETSLGPYLIKTIVNRVGATPEQAVVAAVLGPVLAYLGLSLSITSIFRFYDWVALRFKPRLQQKIIGELSNHISGQAHSFYQNNFAGALANKINDVSMGIWELITITTDRFLALALAILVAIFTLYQIDFKFALTLATWVAVFIFICLRWGARAHKLSDNLSEIRSTITGRLVDVFSNISSVRFFSARRYEKEQLHHITEKMVHSEQKLDWLFLKVWIFQSISIVTMEAICIWLLVTGREAGTISVGDFALIFTITSYIFHAMWNLSKDVVHFTAYLGRVTQGLRLTTQPHLINDVPNAPALQVTKGEINFKKVHFSYPDTEPPLFSNKSIVIHGGQKVGLVGYSGSGKSTFVSLILRLFDLQSGQILIDGQDIAHVTQDSLRAAISMIPQDPVLFHRSLMDNIAYGQSDATQEKIIHAAQKAHAHEFISLLPEGYEALVGERGIKLSGGQRQRIAIARAILKNAPILILDEATSALDSVTEALIQESLLQLMQGKTTIVVAHRLSTLLYMDRILVFDHGKIIEDGSHAELLARNGRYKQLWDAQVGGFLPD